MKLIDRENQCAIYPCKELRWVGCEDGLCPKHCRQKEAGMTIEL